MGGLGKDLLQGGADNDFFVFANVADSGTTKTKRDVITDFQDGADLIDLSAIDADRTNGTGNDTFTYMDTHAPFTGNAGEIRAYWTADGQIIEADTNGDMKADFSIEIYDPTHSIVFSGNDFVL
jgi:Ca2+-binding RTX toxin-like protein